MERMKNSQGMQAERSARARQLATSDRSVEVMTIQCPHSHHLGRIFDTPDGPVIEMNLNRRSHGRLDLHSDPHGVDKPSLWHDFLHPSGDPALDDVIPTGCACGDRLLSRSTIAEWMDDHESRVIVE